MNRHVESAEFEWVRKMMIDHFSDLTVEHVRKLGEGWMSRAYLVNDEFVFRFPKEKAGAIDTEKEIRALHHVAKHISLDTPSFIYCGKQENGFPFVGYKIVPGEPMDEDQFSFIPSEIKDKLAIQIATFITEMRSFSVEKAKELHIPEHNFHQDYSELFQAMKEKAYPHIRPDMQAYLTHRFETYLATKDYFIYSPTLLHADLSLDHLLFDQATQQLTGIIDFGDMKIGDPDYEYIYLLEECGEDFARKVMEIQHKKDIPFMLEKLSFFMTADNVKVLLEGIKRNDGAMVDEAVEIIRGEME